MSPVLSTKDRERLVQNLRGYLERGLYFAEAIDGASPLKGFRELMAEFLRKENFSFLIRTIQFGRRRKLFS